MIPPISTVECASVHWDPARRNVLITVEFFFRSFRTFFELSKTCDDAEPEYEYYDLDVGLGIHGEPEEAESSGEEIFDMPSFEALIGDKPGKSGKEYDPYSGSTGPLVAATLYRKYEYAEGIKTDGEIVIEKTETNVVDNIFGKAMNLVSDQLKPLQGTQVSLKQYCLVYLAPHAVHY